MCSWFVVRGCADEATLGELKAENDGQKTFMSYRRFEDIEGWQLARELTKRVYAVATNHEPPTRNHAALTLSPLSDRPPDLRLCISDGGSTEVWREAKRHEAGAGRESCWQGLKGCPAVGGSSSVISWLEQRRRPGTHSGSAGRASMDAAGNHS